MTFKGVRLRIDHAKMTATVGPIAAAAVRRGADATQKRYRENIVASGLVNTGKLSRSVITQPVPGSPLYPRMAVGSPLEYVKYPEYGTRAHGPVTASRLRFTPNGGSGFVYAKWVRGVRPYKFAKRALDSIRPTDFER